MAGESRKLADEAGDFLRKAREAVSGSRGALQRLRRCQERFIKAEDAFHLFRMLQVETEIKHKTILTRRTYPVLPTAQGSACAVARGFAELNKIIPCVILVSLLCKHETSCTLLQR